jgi:hypothetical protein
MTAKTPRGADRLRAALPIERDPEERAKLQAIIAGLTRELEK